ncbi:MAG: hypothetical protein ACK2T3_09200 [Candidatus Promineifilaceae bacterium]
MQRIALEIKSTGFLFVTLLMLFLITGCRQSDPSPTAPSDESDEPSAEKTAVSIQPLSPTPMPATPETFPAQVVHYNLGEAMLVQDQFPEDSKFRNMPVRLEGVIGVPESDTAHPVVLILHGSHDVCGGEDIWPCPEEVEQKNYQGFAYLIEDLAEAGYVALAINVNAEHTFAYGESPPSIRTQQLIDLHLEELIAANAGESDKFGVNVTGRADLSRMVWLGHSRGGDFANWLVREQDLAQTANPLGYGPVDGIIFVAPANMFVDALPMVDVPFSVILPACDTDIAGLNGQGFYESARFDSERENWGTSVYLEGAEHNRFNTILPPNSILDQRPDCTEESMITAVQQQEFLSHYTLDFLQTLYGQPAQASMARERLGMFANNPVPSTFHDAAIRFSFLPAADEKLVLMKPQSDAELSQNLLGGAVMMSGETAVFCPEGYYVPANAPGSEPCKRVNFNQPGFPQQLVLSWESTDAEWRTTLPEANADLSAYSALQFRAVLDPLSDLNPQGEPQSFTVALVDADGNQAQVVVPPLAYPIGERQQNDFFEGGFFSGHVHMRQVRIPLAEFATVDLTHITEIALVFDQSDTGSLFLADLELVFVEGD